MPSHRRLLRVTDRASFDVLRRGRRGRAGTVTVTFVPAAPGRPGVRAAFQVGRATGPAVVRNRIRRRLRAALRELLAAGRLPEGTYLVGARREAADQPWPSLLEDLGAAVDRATEPRGGDPR